MKSPLQRRSGFTLLEVTVACWLTAFLAVLLSTTWVLVMRPTADLIAWGQLFQEMDIAVATLSHDLGGSLPDNGYAGEKKKGRLLGTRQNPIDNNVLELWFDGGNNADALPAAWNPRPDDTVIRYSRDADSQAFVRLNTNSSRSFTAARCVTGMTITAPDSDHLQIELTFSCLVKATNKTLTRKCTLIARKNP
jgi:type II secretory pathway component PulJ